MRPSLQVRLFAAIALVACPADASPQVRIMPLGDSITRGTNDINYPNGSIPGGYRRKLSELLSTSGVAHDFIGENSDNAHAGTDPDHNGNNGWRTDEMLAALPGWLAASPDIVLLHAGSNDILQDIPVATAVANLSSLIDSITSGNPGRRLHVATIIPITQNWNGRSAAYLNGNADAYNVQVRNLVQQFAGQGRNVHLVEMNGNIVCTNSDPPLNFYQPGDGIHPGQAGYNQMGTIWHAAVMAHAPFFPTPPAGAPDAPSGVVAKVITGSRINVSWTDESTNETGFEVWHKTGFSGTWQSTSTAADAGIEPLTGVAAGAGPFFSAVRAINASGASAWSEVVTTTPEEIAAGRPATSSSSYAAAYVAARAVDGNATTLWSAANGDTAAWWQVDLGTPQRIHAVQLVTRQDVNFEEARRNFEIRGSNDPGFATYVVLTGQGPAALAHASTFHGNTSSATAFRHLRVAKTDAASFTIAEVRVFGAVPPAPPAAPGNLAATPSGADAISVSWTDASADETGFKLERRSGGGVFGEIAVLPAGITIYQDSGLAAGSAHVYRVRATNGVDDSAFSAEAAAEIVQDPYAAWASAYPEFLALAAEERMPGADANDDGYPNLLAHAMALDPLAQVPTDAFGVMKSGPNAFFRYRRNKQTDAVFEVFVSTDLAESGWMPLSQDEAMLENMSGDPLVELVTVPLPPATGGRQFAVLRATMEDP